MVNGVEGRGRERDREEIAQCMARMKRSMASKEVEVASRVE